MWLPQERHAYSYVGTRAIIGAASDRPRSRDAPVVPPPAERATSFVGGWWEAPWDTLPSLAEEACLMKVKKAVIPAAGLGTRFLPATKSQPKEMLPVVDKPAIQYVVEHAVGAGIEDILIVTGRGKRTIEDHFDRSFELELRLERAGKYEELKQVREISEMAAIHFIRQ